MKKIIYALLFLFFISFASAAIIIQESEKPNIKITHPTAASNYSLINVNNSDYWDNLNTPADINHNDLANKQGGQSGQFYHLNLSIYTEILSNVFNYITGSIANSTYRKLSDTINPANITSPIWVNKTGDIMTGNLTINNADLSLSNNYKIYLGSATIESNGTTLIIKGG